MARSTWEDTVGSVVAETYRVHTLVSAGPYQAEFLASTASATGGKPDVSVTLIAPGPAEVEQQLAAIERAKQLQHPNLLRVLDGGTCSVNNTSLLFVAADTAGATLAEELAAGPLPDAKVRVLTKDLAAALDYLHGRGFVCQSVAPDTIVRAGDQWKLADLSQLQRVGEGAPSEGDIWALGITLREVLTARGRGGSPFDAIVSGCLEPDPAKRLRLQQIKELLEVGAAPQTTVSETRPAPRRSGATIAMVASLLIFLSVVLALVTHRDHPRPAPAAPPAPSTRLPDRTVRAPAERPSPFTGKIEVTSTPASPQQRSPERPAQRPPSTTTPSQTPPAQAGTEPAAPGEQGRVGLANYFADSLNGQPTANGETFSNDAMTAAHPDLPFGTRLRITNLKSGRSVIVRVNDRGLFRQGFVIMITRAAAEQLGFVQAGSARVKIEVIQ